MIIIMKAVIKQSFDTYEAARAAGIDVGKLQNWLSRGLIVLEGERNPGRGKSREYTDREVARICLMKDLADFGVPLSSAFKLTQAVKKAFAEGWEYIKPQPRTADEPTYWITLSRAQDWKPKKGEWSVISDGGWVLVLFINNPKSPKLDRAIESVSGPALVRNLSVFVDNVYSKLRPFGA
jgi:DNA-binding transcriptional MerR regulator